ncbi:MAG: tRNA (adenosine(37)-N6)-threonylcarbamoyltransferase complex dimerization subunit type 1 TsaB [Polaribacter sp.]
MAYILNIETSTKNCSVSIANNGEVVAIKELNNGDYSHAEVLHVFIDDILKSNGILSSELDAIAVSKGPGSYTGLRIGVSAAKGLSFAHNIPLISVDTLKVLASSINVTDGYIAPMIDARRLEVYASVFDCELNLVSPTEAKVIDSDSYQEYLESQKVYFLGDGSEKCKSILTHKNAHFIDNHHPSAKEMAILSYDKFKKEEFEDVAYFEPFYLKDFIVIPEKKRKPTY